MTSGFFAQVQFGGLAGLTDGGDGLVKEKNRSLEAAVNELGILGPFRSHPVPEFLAFSSCRGQPFCGGLGILTDERARNLASVT
jgi:hypothetical protein